MKKAFSEENEDATWLVGSPAPQTGETREVLSPIRDPGGNVMKQWTRNSPQKRTTRGVKHLGVKAKKFDPRRESMAMNKFFEQLSLGKSLDDVEQPESLDVPPTASPKRKAPRKMQRTALMSKSALPAISKSQTEADTAAQAVPELSPVQNIGKTLPVLDQAASQEQSRTSIQDQPPVGQMSGTVQQPNPEDCISISTAEGIIAREIPHSWTENALPDSVQAERPAMDSLQAKSAQNHPQTPADLDAPEMAEKIRAADQALQISRPVESALESVSQQPQPAAAMEVIHDLPANTEAEAMQSNGKDSVAFDVELVTPSATQTEASTLSDAISASVRSPVHEPSQFTPVLGNNQPVEGGASDQPPRITSLLGTATAAYKAGGSPTPQTITIGAQETQQTPFVAPVSAPAAPAPGTPSSTEQLSSNSAEESGIGEVPVSVQTPVRLMATPSMRLLVTEKAGDASGGEIAAVDAQQSGSDISPRPETDEERDSTMGYASAPKIGHLAEKVSEGADPAVLVDIDPLESTMSPASASHEDAPCKGVDPQSEQQEGVAQTLHGGEHRQPDCSDVSESSSEEESSSDDDEVLERPVVRFQFPSQLLADFANTITPVRNLTAKSVVQLDQVPEELFRSSPLPVTDHESAQASAQKLVFADMDDSPEQASPIAPSQVTNAADQLTSPDLEHTKPVSPLKPKQRLTSHLASAAPTSAARRTLEVTHLGAAHRPWSASNDIRWELDGENSAEAPSGIQVTPVLGAAPKRDEKSSTDTEQLPLLQPSLEETLTGLDEVGQVPVVEDAVLQEETDQDNNQIREESDEPIFAYVSASGIVTPAKVAQTPATATRPSTLRKSRFQQASTLRQSLVSSFAETEENEEDLPSQPKSAELTCLPQVQEIVSNPELVAAMASPAPGIPIIDSPAEAVNGISEQAIYEVTDQLDLHDQYPLVDLAAEQRAQTPTLAVQYEPMEEDLNQWTEDIQKPLIPSVEAFTQLASLDLVAQSDSPAELHEDSKTVIPSSQASSLPALEAVSVEASAKPVVENQPKSQAVHNSSPLFPWQKDAALSPPTAMESEVEGVENLQTTGSLRAVPQPSSDNRPAEQLLDDQLNALSLVEASPASATTKRSDPEEFVHIELDTKQTGSTVVLDSSNNQAKEDETNVDVITQELSGEGPVVDQGLIHSADTDSKEMALDQAQSVGGLHKDSCQDRASSHGSQCSAAMEDESTDAESSSQSLASSLRLSIATERLLGSLTVPLTRPATSQADESPAAPLTSTFAAEKVKSSRTPKPVLKGRVSPASASSLTRRAATGASMSPASSSSQTRSIRVTRQSAAPEPVSTVRREPRAAPIISRLPKAAGAPTRLAKGGQNTENEAQQSNIPKPPSDSRPPRASTVAGSSLPRFNRAAPQPSRLGQPSAQQKTAEARKTKTGISNSAPTTGASKLTSRPPSTLSGLARSSGVPQSKSQASQSAGARSLPSKPAAQQPDASPAPRPPRLSDTKTPAKDRRTPDYERMLNAALANEAMAFKGLGAKVANSPADGLKRPLRTTKLTAYDKHVKDWDGEPLA